MMPWEHVVVGYVTYSLFIHVFYRDSPTGSETLVVVFASIFPDLIDKSLAWQFGVFDGGFAVAHSVFFAVPLSLVALFLAYYRGRPQSGWAFEIGYLLHLPADVIPRSIAEIRQGEFTFERLLWPLHNRGRPHNSFVEGFFYNFQDYISQLLNMEFTLFMKAVIVLTVFAFLLWIYDGMPVVHEMCISVRESDYTKPGVSRDD